MDRLTFKITKEQIELNPGLTEAGFVEGDLFEIDVRPVVNGKVGPRPGDRDKVQSDESNGE